MTYSVVFRDWECIGGFRVENGNQYNSHCDLNRYFKSSFKLYRFCYDGLKRAFPAKIIPKLFLIFRLSIILCFPCAFVLILPSTAFVSCAIASYCNEIRTQNKGAKARKIILYVAKIHRNTNTKCLDKKRNILF